MDGLAKVFCLWGFDRNEKKYHPFIKKNTQNTLPFILLSLLLHLVVSYKSV